MLFGVVSHVQNPNPSHVESIVSDFEVWMYGLVNAHFRQSLVSKKTTRMQHVRETVWGIVLAKLLEEDEDDRGCSS